MPSVQLAPSGQAVPVTNVFVIGKNYLASPEAKAAQRGQPLIVCMKPTSSVLAESEPIHLPAFSDEVHFEVELLLLIGKEGSNIPVERAGDHILGLGVGLDLTALDLQQQAQETGSPWMRCKGFRCGAPVSKFLCAKDIESPDQAGFSLRVNGELRQQGNAADMVFSPGELVSKLSEVCPLTRGDIIFTGTPTGAGRLSPGDRLELELLGRVRAQFHVA